MSSSLRKTTRAQEIGPNETDIPGGWPRAYYRDETGKPRYTQWSSGDASSQIVICHSDRLWTAAKFFACTSCAQVMERGMLLDLEWMNTEMNARWPEGVDFEKEEGCTSLSYPVWGGPTGYSFDEYDGQYGGAICHRCLVFAIKHCPYFSRLHTLFGDDFLFIEARDGLDFAEFDTTGAIDPTEQGKERPRVSLREIRQRVAAGQLYLSEHSMESAVEARPRNAIWNCEQD